MAELITHRCKGSLKARASIRYDDDKYLPKEWILRLVQFDTESWGLYPHYCGRIDYCPYCGQRLEEPPWE